MLTRITPTASFKDNVLLLPPIDDIEQVDLLDGQGTIVATIENQPGKKGSVAVYQYLHQSCDTLDAEAARHGLEVFAEHVADARERPGAHPNIDRLLVISQGAPPLNIAVR